MNTGFKYHRHGQVGHSIVFTSSSSMKPYSLFSAASSSLLSLPSAPSRTSCRPSLALEIALKTVIPERHRFFACTVRYHVRNDEWPRHYKPYLLHEAHAESRKWYVPVPSTSSRTTGVLVHPVDTNRDARNHDKQYVFLSSRASTQVTKICKPLSWVSEIWTVCGLQSTGSTYARHQRTPCHRLDGF